MDWKRKLTSRKLWAAVVSFVALLVVALGGTEAQATQITALIMAGATVVAYIVGEGLVDAASAGASTLPAEALDTPDKTATPTANASQTGAEDAHAAFPGLDNITLDQANAAVEAANIALGKATSDEDKAQLNLYLTAAKSLQAAKAAESGAVAPDTTGAA